MNESCLELFSDVRGVRGILMDEDNHRDKKEHMNSKLKSFVKSLKWEDYVLIAIILFVATLFTVHTSQYKTIPSPVFGGDVFRDRGFVKNIAEGNAIWSDGFYLDEIQYYGYIIPALEAGVVRIFGLEVDTVFLYSAVLFLILSMICWYILGKEFFSDKRYALLVSVASLIFNSYSLKFHYLAIGVFLPLLLYFWLKYELKGKIWHGVLTGLFLGLASLVYGGLLIPLSTIFFGFIILSFFSDLNIKNIRNINSIILKYIKKYYLATTVFIMLMLTYFLPLMIKYGMKIVNDVPHWGDIAPSALDFGWFFGIVRGMFFNYSSVPLFLISVTCLIGVIGLLLSKPTVQKRILLYALLINLLLSIHHWITIPLLNTYFWPSKMLVISSFLPLFFVVGMKFLSDLLFKSKEDTKRNFLVGAALIILLSAFMINFYSMKNSQWEMYGKQENAYVDSLYDLADYMHSNIKNDEAILSNDETGFMLAVLSGKKVMLTRRTHASYYVDIDKRIADASVVMYGKDVNLSRQILSSYDVKYFYMDANIFQNEMRTRLEFKNYLDTNNVFYVEMIDRYDIAVPPDRAVLMPMLVIPPQNLTEEFMSLWELDYNVVVQGQVVGQLYKLKE